MDVYFMGISRFFARISEWVFPQTCVECGLWSPWPLCLSCFSTHRPHLNLRTLSADIPIQSRFFFFYEGALKTGIFQYKFEGITSWRSIFIRLLAQALPTCPFPDVEWWIPVPPHPNRLKRRGFDPVFGLFSPVLDSWGKCLTPVVRRIYETPPLFSLSKSERRDVLTGAFKVESRFVHLLKGQKVVIVDDILTSGSTVNAISEALYACGVVRIEVITLFGVEL